RAHRPEARSRRLGAYSSSPPSISVRLLKNELLLLFRPRPYSSSSSRRASRAFSKFRASRPRPPSSSSMVMILSSSPRSSQTPLQFGQKSILTFDRSRSRIAAPQFGQSIGSSLEDAHVW